MTEASEPKRRRAAEKKAAPDASIQAQISNSLAAVTQSRKKAPGPAENTPAEARQAQVAEKHRTRQLALWSDADRGIPNEFARGALFPAKNHKEKRAVYKADRPLSVPIIGGGQILFIGEEFRQDDETVWLQLVHLAKEARSDWVSFTPHAFLTNIKWPVKGDSYKRLLTSIRRLAAASIEVYSGRFDKGLKTQLLRNYEYSMASMSTPWRVKLFDSDDNLLFLFEKLYTRLDWETRLMLPAGAATWLHGFYSTHKEPFAHKVETLAVGAGLKLTEPGEDAFSETERKRRRTRRLNEAKRTLVRAHDALVEQGFLARYQVVANTFLVVRGPGRGEAQA